MRIWVSLFSVLLLAGCATNSVDLDYNSQIDFNRINSYMLRSPAPEANPLTSERLRKAIDAQLASKGWRLMSPDEQPLKPNQVSIGYRSWLETRYKDSDINIGIGAGRSGGHTSIGGAINIPIGSNEQQVQIVRIDMFQQGQLIWRAMDNAGVNPKDSPQKRSARVEQLVARLLAKFPPDR